jgi:asparagine synthase (glutamine-hydrolysing)
VTPPEFVAFGGWPEIVQPPGAWSGTDATGLPVSLAARGEPLAASEDGSIVAAVGGTIYNHVELRTHLSGRHAFDRRTQAEAVVHLYEERGLHLLKALRGAFALALWDGRLGRLVLARDQLGLRPLYYLTDGRRLAAASTFAALTALPGVSAAWDLAALDTFLALGCIPPPRTVHPAVRQLRPGEAVVWQNGRLRTQVYWQLTFPERRLGRRNLGSLFRAQVLEALRVRQAGTVSGLLLSAGLDAGGLLALAAAERPPAVAYTVRLGGDADESKVAAALAAEAGVRHVIVDEPDWPAAADAVLATYGAPAGGADAAVLRAASAAAADVGVVLAGIGGDQVFGGSPMACTAHRLHGFRRLPGVVREAAEMLTRVLPGRWPASLRHLVAAERLAPVEAYALEASLFTPAEREALLTPDTLASVGEAGPWSGLTELFADAVAAGATEAVDVIHYVDLVLQLPAQAAVARLATDVGVDLRLPFADHRLAQLVASVPAAARATGRDRQLLLRAAVPAPVSARAHASPQPSADAWGRGSLRVLLDDTLSPARVKAQGLFQPETVARLVDEHLGGVRDHGARLWRLILVARWVEQQASALAPIARVAG